MHRQRLSRLAVVLVAAVGVSSVTQTATASPPTDLTSLGPLLPDCTASAPDTSGAHICWVTPLRPGWQASTGEWIVIRVGDAISVDPANPNAARTRCEQEQASIVATTTLDGVSLPVDTIACELRLSGDPAQPDVWFVDYRALSHPLTPGEHTFSVSWLYTLAVPGVANAGDTAIFPTRTVTVIPQG